MFKYDQIRISRVSNGLVVNALSEKEANLAVAVTHEDALTIAKEFLNEYEDPEVPPTKGNQTPRSDGPSPMRFS